MTNYNNVFKTNNPPRAIKRAKPPRPRRKKQMPADKTTGAQREKLDSLPYDLVPFIEMTEAFVRVAEFGAKKYEPWNWTKGLKRTQLCASLLRHVFAYLRGQDRDKDSGLLHTDHILWNATALCHSVEHGICDDRRPEPSRDYSKLRK